MMSSKVVCLISLATFGLVSGNPATSETWRSAPMDGLVEELKTSCTEGSDPTACLQYKVSNLLDNIFKRDTFQVSEDVELTKNGAGNAATGRSAGDFFDNLENFIQSHDVTFQLPLADTKVTVSPRNLDQDELNLNIKFASDANEGKSAGEARKAKLKKIIVPILVFVLLKAMTLIPLAIGVLGLKAWNALQLSFFSFVVSVALAIFQLCKKIAADNSHPQIAAHGPWDAAYAAARHKRSLDTSLPAHDMAYNAYL
ncbi:hypothetical protein EVAR_82789_1 [Eumeta japonica]|uniref:Osiris 19 n=1 Tax=Eumeta variegata TaxID=151549 RepID=A0A4C1UNI4_EUMVA|nr:hypothetical protein EVAR_82789_1 [Eumeta japonica]